eukprot:GHVU01220504.1.p1 GENE.GHVU01220504.1~~GHVU01220504.1.p1  ORF type:complete len:264 (-),score=20.34 GHVU01220504.1:168-959(-)
MSNCGELYVFQIPESTVEKFEQVCGRESVLCKYNQRCGTGKSSSTLAAEARRCRAETMVSQHSERPVGEGSPASEDATSIPGTYLRQGQVRFPRRLLRLKYPLPSIYVLGLATEGWEKGEPASVGALVAAVKVEFGGEDSADARFRRMHLESYSCDSALRKWVRRTLRRGGFSERAKTMGQYVPLGWNYKAKAAGFQNKISLSNTIAVGSFACPSPGPKGRFFPTPLPQRQVGIIGSGAESAQNLTKTSLNPRIWVDTRKTPG